jgi:glycosyltransferase involved in cell wall biosynthesis
MQYSVVIPVFNEEESLDELQRRIHQVMKGITSEHEIIYVNDGSFDKSLEVLNRLQNEFREIRIIPLAKRRGQSYCLARGFHASRGEWIITLDGDLQNPPEEIPTLTQYVNQYDFITGVRKIRNDIWSKRVASQVARLFRLIVLGDHSRDTGCSLKVFKKNMLQKIPLFKNFHRFFPFLAISGGCTIKEVMIQHDQRKYGKSKYGNIKRAFDGVIDLLGVLWLRKRMISYDQDV